MNAVDSNSLIINLIAIEFKIPFVSKIEKNLFPLSTLTQFARKKPFEEMNNRIDVLLIVLH